jgi:hypothetical protein
MGGTIPDFGGKQGIDYLILVIDYWVGQESCMSGLNLGNIWAMIDLERRYGYEAQ